MKKEFYNLEVVNTVKSIRKLLNNPDKTKDIPIKFRWNLKKNLDVLSPTVISFDEFRQELTEELQKDFFNDEKSHVDESMHEEDGLEYRKVNEEYMDEYREKVKEINDELNDLLKEKHEYEIIPLDIDKFVEGLPDDTALTFEDVELFSLMDK